MHVNIQYIMFAHALGLLTHPLSTMALHRCYAVYLHQTYGYSAGEADDIADYIFLRQPRHNDVPCHILRPMATHWNLPFPEEKQHTLLIMTYQRYAVVHEKMGYHYYFLPEVLDPHYTFEHFLIDVFLMDLRAFFTVLIAKLSPPNT